PTAHVSLVLFLMLRPPPRSALFPYTTLFRSCVSIDGRLELHRRLVHNLRVEPGRPLTRGMALRRRQLDQGRHRRRPEREPHLVRDRKSTRLNSSHRTISYAVFCLKKKNNQKN